VEYLSSFEEEMGKVMLEFYRVSYSKYRFEYLLKVDDTTYLRPSRLVEHLEALPNKDLYWGKMYLNYSVGDPMKESYDPLYVNISTHYALFAVGAHLLSNNLVEWLVSSSIPFATWRNLDSHTGTWLIGLDIHRINSRKEVWVKGYSKLQDCAKQKTFIVHGIDNLKDHYDIYSADTQKADICKNLFFRSPLLSTVRVLRRRPFVGLSTFEPVKKYKDLCLNFDLIAIVGATALIFFIVFAYSFLTTYSINISARKVNRN